MPEVAIKTTLHDVTEPIYHTDLDCEHVTDSHVIRPLSGLPNHRDNRECRVCAGEYDGGSGPNTKYPCPKCGGEFGSIPKHLPACDGGALDD